MAQRKISAVSREQVRKNAMVMTVAALTTLIGFALPWFRFKSSLAFDQEPEALVAFEQDLAPAGPLTIFTHFPLHNTGIDGVELIARGLVILYFVVVVMMVIAALVAWRRGHPLWPVRLSVILAPLLSLLVIGTWQLVGINATVSSFYARTIPLPGWWLSLLAPVVLFFRGLNVLRAAFSKG